MHARQHLELGDLKVRGRADTGKNGLRLACSAMDVEAQLHHALDYVLNLFVRGSVLHCDDHHWIPSRAVRMTALACECVRVARDKELAELRDICAWLALAAGDWLLV
jgi:hypothetical protein